jgi:hypothetical protein
MKRISSANIPWSCHQAVSVRHGTSATITSHRSRSIATFAIQSAIARP